MKEATTYSLSKRDVGKRSTGKLFNNVIGDWQIDLTNSSTYSNSFLVEHFPCRTLPSFPKSDLLQWYGTDLTPHSTCCLQARQHLRRWQRESALSPWKPTLRSPGETCSTWLCCPRAPALWKKKVVGSQTELREKVSPIHRVQLALLAMSPVLGPANTDFHLTSSSHFCGHTTFFDS